MAHLRGVTRDGRQRGGRQHLSTTAGGVAAVLARRAKHCAATHGRVPRQPVTLGALTLSPMPPVAAQRIERRAALHTQHLGLGLGVGVGVGVGAGVGLGLGLGSGLGLGLGLGFGLGLGARA